MVFTLFGTNILANFTLFGTKAVFDATKSVGKGDLSVQNRQIKNGEYIAYTGLNILLILNFFLKLFKQEFDHIRITNSQSLLQIVMYQTQTQYMQKLKRKIYAVIFTTLSSTSPPGVLIEATSPTFLPTKPAPTGLMLLITPCRGSDSVSPTIL